MTPSEVREAVHHVAQSICDAGEAGRFGVIACDEGSALLVPRAALADAVHSLCEAHGTTATKDQITRWLAELAAAPAWQVPIVLWIGNELTHAVYVPTRGQS